MWVDVQDYRIKQIANKSNVDLKYSYSNDGNIALNHLSSVHYKFSKITVVVSPSKNVILFDVLKFQEI